MNPHIDRLRSELERLEASMDTCHPDVHDELKLLIEDVRAHILSLQTAQDVAEQNSSAF